MIRRLPVSLVAMALVLWIARAPLAQVCSAGAIPLAPGLAQPGDLAGHDVAAFGPVAMVGFPTNSGAAVGSVVVVRRVDASWSVEDEISPPGALPGSAFGFSVAYDGSRLVVGAPFDGPTQEGGVYVYERIGASWIETEKLVGGGGSFGFGRDVAVSGDTIVVSGFGSFGEQVWVFRRVGGVTFEEANLAEPGGSSSHQFGASVAVVGGRVAVGAPTADVAGTDSGAIYVFERGSGDWVAARIDPPGLAAGDRFGSSVALSGDRLLAGAPLADTTTVDAGRAHLFRFDAGIWVEEKTLAARDNGAPIAGGTGDRFGEGVAIDGDLLLVGAPGADCRGTDNGAVYAYTLNGGEWLLQQRFGTITPTLFTFDQDFGRAVAVAGRDGVAGAPALTAASPRGGAFALPCLDLAARLGHEPVGADRFGFAVSAFGETILCGAPHTPGPLGETLVGAASVWVPRGTAWEKEAELVPDVVAANTWFGYAASLSGDTAIVTAPFGTFGGIRSGLIRAFVRTGATWAQQGSFGAPGALFGEGFGLNVACDGDVVVSGALGDNDMGTHAGTAYVFRRTGTTWAFEQQLYPDVVSPYGKFGTTVAVSGDTIVVGAPANENGNEGIGAVYVFQRNAGVWTLQAKFLNAPAAVGDAFGTSVSISGDRIAVGDASDDERGAVSVFVKSGVDWIREDRLVQADRDSLDRFGAGVSLVGDLLAVAAPQDQDDPKSRGTVSLYQLRDGTWSLRRTLFAADGGSPDLFGSMVSIDRGGAAVLAVADFQKFGVLNNAGAVYAYRLDTLPPVIECPTLIVAHESTPGGSAVVEFSVTATDDIDPAPLVECDYDSGYLFPSGETVVSCRAVDEMDRESFCSFTVHVVPDEVFYRRGNVNAAAGEIGDVLFVNGSPGDPVARTLRLATSDPLEMRVERPPSKTSGTSKYAMYLWLRVPTAATVRTLPAGIGVTCLPTPLNGPGGPQPKRIANNIGYTGQLGAENWPGPPTSPAPAVLLSLVPVGRPITLFAQGLVLDSASVHGTVAVTNGIEVVVE